MGGDRARERLPDSLGAGCGLLPCLAGNCLGALPLLPRPVFQSMDMLSAPRDKFRFQKHLC